ncbi:hypothetical protein DSO57_1036676 [Entomophthora muscae]|uniref:Uncharacterized protein n=1 Tax=Entomophthora muscae TaxID=34485 RepID=A0ACC2UJI9_9FUNG|nr:hypothetical protein DSO57_1036676 [Entomophthora muscae]
MALELLQVPNLGSSSPHFWVWGNCLLGFQIGQFPHPAGVGSPLLAGRRLAVGRAACRWLAASRAVCSWVLFLLPGILRQFPQSGGTAAIFILLFEPNCPQKIILTKGVVKNIPDTMTLPLTLQPNPPMEPVTAAETTSTQLFGVLYITLTGLVDSMVPNSRPWSLLGRSISYIIKLASILWCALPTGLVVPCPETPNASSYAWIPESHM